MRQQKPAVRAWAVVFWLLVWQGASLALRAIYPHGALLLASPIDALRRLFELALTAAFWQTVGILHDLDFEQYPDQHCTKEAEILREKGMDERLVHAVVSHGYLLTVDVQPEHQMEKVLYATDELTGLIGAVVRMLPTKSVQDLQLKSLKKKFKDKKFAAGCSREVIERGADMLGWSLDELMERTINAMQASPAANGN